MGSGSRLHRKIAVRYLWSKRSEAFIFIITAISILGVAVGVMVLTMVMAIMTGFEVALKDKIVGADSHIVVHGTGGRIEKWEDVREKVINVPGVSSVSPFTYNQVLVKSDAHASGILIRGVSKDTAGADQLAEYIGQSGSLSDLYSPPSVTVVDADGESSTVALPGIIVGKQLSKTLQVARGDIISILSPQLTPTPFGLVPKFRRFVVAGLYTSGLSEYENGIAYVSLAEAQKFFAMGSSVTGLEVRVSDVDDAPRIGRSILDTLGGLGSGFITTDWIASNQALWAALQQEKHAYFVILLLIIVMASFSIITTLVMIVIEKRKDIAILKTMGASTSQIARIFRFQGTFIGAVGTLLGLLLGFSGCLLLRTYGFPLDAQAFQMSQLPISMDWKNFAAVAAAAFAICFVATIYPSRRASALEPSELLRYE